ncbi:GGDEF domain-containing protein, partial [Lysinibacillus sp. D4A3_S15]|uniref:GGDEF domain-containing protein n=1 Tax=Lysinibacillus sp. D4A3_S15 TaxID=2941227 RepID=UPI0020C0F20F
YEQAQYDSSYFKSMFSKIGALVALAFTYARAQRKIWDLAYTDITTGLPNRHNFVNFLEKEVERGQNGYIKIVKPSEFHQVVELYGREFGDELLRKLAKRLEQVHAEDRE